MTGDENGKTPIDTTKANETDRIPTFFPPPQQGEYSLAMEKHKDALREKSPALQALHQRDQDSEKATKEMTIEETAETLGITIKEDKTSKVVVFYGTVLNYTEEDQQNFSSNAPSSVGKTWVSSEALHYFPREDLMDKGYTSPTAFWHLNSELCRDDGEPLAPRNRYVDDAMNSWEERTPLPPKGEGREQWKEKKKTERRRVKNEWDEIEKYYIVNLKQKILHFRDQPHDKLLQNLRPVLSHDAPIIECNITDKTREGGHRTKKILILGYPTVHFNSVRFSLNEQEQTRLWMHSPEITQDKFKATLKQQSVSLADRTAYKEALSLIENRRLLKLRIRLIKESTVRNVILKPEDAEKTYETFLEDHPTLSPRHQRDFPRLIAMIKAHALFNQWTRDHNEDGTAIYANQTDLTEGPKICEALLKSNEKGLPPHVYRFYDEKLLGELEAAGALGLHKPDVARMYFEFYQARIGKKPLKNMIDLLLETGLIIEDVDPNDKRRKKLYTPILGGEKNVEMPEAGLQATMSKVRTVIWDMEQVSGSVRDDDLYAELDHPKHGLNRNEAARVVGVLMKDGTIYSPRPGYYKVCT